MALEDMGPEIAAYLNDICKSLHEILKEINELKRLLEKSQIAGSKEDP